MRASETVASAAKAVLRAGDEEEKQRKRLDKLEKKKEHVEEKIVALYAKFSIASINALTVEQIATLKGTDLDAAHYRITSKNAKGNVAEKCVMVTELLRADVAEQNE